MLKMEGDEMIVTVEIDSVAGREHHHIHQYAPHGKIWKLSLHHSVELQVESPMVVSKHIGSWTIANCWKHSLQRLDQ